MTQSVFADSSGIVEDVVLLGAPVTGSVEKWTEFSKIVAGHITNGYCRSVHICDPKCVCALVGL